MLEFLLKKINIKLHGIIFHIVDLIYKEIDIKDFSEDAAVKADYYGWYIYDRHIIW